jgi:glutaredoxin
MTPSRPFPLSSCAALALAMFALPSHALFKVVAPDGTVTYTDRPPAASVGRPAALGKEAPAADAAAAALAGLPIELRETVARFPVTLYSSTDCAPCESGRRLLQSRGVPFTERRVTNEDDAEALNRLTGGRSVPTLTIGGQALRGYADGDWHSYLDAAGYPRESLLPRSYQPPPATPLVERKPEAAPPVARPAPPAEPIAAPPTTAPSPTGIRF